MLHFANHATAIPRTFVTASVVVSSPQVSQSPLTPATDLIKVT